MDFKRINSILNNDEKTEVFYNERPVWIQGCNEEIAKRNLNTFKVPKLS